MHSNAIFMLRKLADIVPFWNDGFCISPSSRGPGGVNHPIPFASLRGPGGVNHPIPFASTRGLGGFFASPASFAFDQKQTKQSKIYQIQSIHLIIN